MSLTAFAIIVLAAGQVALAVGLAAVARELRRQAEHVRDLSASRRL